ncbi:MAG: hypothetical protein HW384_1024 [Dehalococcoidia bacterium]|nr:hypothetical protein [Dehalococcoidia bacterium]
MQRSALVPYLEIISYETKDNTLILDIENLSDSTARGMGISTSFYLVFPRYTADSKGIDVLSSSRLEHLVKDNVTVFVKYFLFGPNEPKLIWEGKQVRSVEVISFPETGTDAAYFPPHHKSKVEFKPRFMVETKETLASGKAFLFDEFKEFLLQNNIGYCAVDIKLVYQDLTETQIGYDSFCRFVINPMAHTTIEESCKDKASFDFLPLSIREIQLKNKWIDKSIYKRFKSPWNRSEEEIKLIEKFDQD